MYGTWVNTRKGRSWKQKTSEKHPKGQKFFAVEIFQIRSNVHTPFATSLFPRRCLAWVDWELMTTTFDIDEARGRWPSDASELPADAQAAFAVWSQAPATAVKAALENDAEWRRPGAGTSYRKLDKARDLVLLRTPFPRNVRTDGARPLTDGQNRHGDRGGHQRRRRRTTVFFRRGSAGGDASHSSGPAGDYKFSGRHYPAAVQGTTRRTHGGRFVVYA